MSGVCSYSGCSNSPIDGEIYCVECVPKSRLRRDIVKAFMLLNCYQEKIAEFIAPDLRLALARALVKDIVGQVDVEAAELMLSMKKLKEKLDAFTRGT